ncbi:chemotaxis response regulator protein-glutamate methylesterase [Herbaspirillum seropedicae]|uniref:Protein-glutamate methylesterase/protein-glutamine glutaminase n=1 Tax=Herbaspirillum seropedicae (strain SmR1) TaxID=757424 RepID=D8J0E9_HERSS|nr:chemotaxis response regulator protein-glutamate methylesterase [Herbaspirillum seropedicae]ADJ64505.1 protein-glutamate methylesterase protein [Herbaspirillum seropedicae SmR1]AKN66435.1 chemotaxis protein [Herbaspirillum seropedicae]MDR6393680.1 two-component system chemotaxis response regulator CheB/two-component system response regulator WspF [Herbaspirillum seropedicae]NQE30463.1 chemotaxis protein [Herbaspirillum seropedicae]UMU22423.1 chemotaxis response regulator protein-glutamate me
MKIGIVNDTPMMVEVLRRVIAESGRHELIWIARDGEQAVQMCAWQLPDVVLMDLLMPKVDGAEATRRIMEATPCPILVVTSDMDTSADKIYEAMGYGALDATQTPALIGAAGKRDAAALIEKIDNLGRLSPEMVSPPVRGGRAETLAPAQPARADSLPPLVAVGASAGGPAALATLLKAIPQGFAGAVVIVQHIDAAFAPGMAQWLQQQSALKVGLAQEGQAPQRGAVLLAASNRHLVVKEGGRLGYVEGAPNDVYRPSVDVFFQSIVRHWPGKVAGLLLTGMGRDGAAGLKALRDSGAHTMAQDQKSCAVYGMPKAAVALNAAVEVLPVTGMAARLQAIIV